MVPGYMNLFMNFPGYMTMMMIQATMIFQIIELNFSCSAEPNFAFRKEISATTWKKSRDEKSSAIENDSSKLVIAILVYQHL